MENAGMAELVDAGDLKSSVEKRPGSSPGARINDLAYLAGIIDGEGSIYFDNSRERGWPQAVLSVASNDLELIEWLKGNFGGWFCTKRDKRVNTISYDWRLTGTNAAQILAQVYPFLQIKRRIRRTEIVVKYYLAVTENEKGDLLDKFIYLQKSKT